MASALNPSAASTRAEPASHGFGITNGSPACKAANAAAFCAWPTARRYVLAVPRRPVLVCALLAPLLGFAAMVPALHSSGWSFSALPRVDARSGMAAAARALDPGFHTVQTGAYDGQFYWGIAVDPLATGSVHAQFDKASYRYGHPLYGWLGWIFSAGVGRAAAAALAAVGLASLLVSAAAAMGGTLRSVERRAHRLGRA